jgi:two-component system, OmpR family, sensor kinase
VRRVPIRLRVAAAFAVVMAIVLAGSGFFLYSRLASHLLAEIDNDLQLRSQDLAALVGRGGSLTRDSGGRLIERGESYAQLVSPSGRVLGATSPLGRVRLLDGAQRSEALRRPVYVDKPSVRGLNEPSRILATAATRNGRRVVLLVGVTLENRAETLAQFRDELLIAGPLALLLATGVGYLLAGVSLRQVDRMRRRAGEISAQTPGERLPVPRSGDEIERLGTTLNEMLDRLEAGLLRERRFVADAGHELRTPLALLRTELELALRHAGTPAEMREALRRSFDETDRLAQLAEDLLVIARSDGHELPLRWEELQVDELFASVARRVETRAESEGKMIDVDGRGMTVHADRLRLEQALGNMVDNAIRHGGDEIRLEAVTRNGSTELHVTDDGPGFPDGFLEHAFDRFSRADPARARGGAGLGLAIVRTIAEAHGGSAHVDPHGQPDVWIALPA